MSLGFPHLIVTKHPIQVFPPLPSTPVLAPFLLTSTEGTGILPKGAPHAADELVKKVDVF